MKVRRTFVFHPERDRDLLEALAALPDGEKSRLVRTALRRYLQARAGEPTLTDILAQLQRLQAGRQPEPAETTEDDEFTNALLDLGL
jgi:hypothetical protein